jgi:hypothetical protein
MPEHTYDEDSQNVPSLIIPIVHVTAKDGYYYCEMCPFATDL